ncbi:hypothetical protein TWF694_008296 [Orbilia ellipsospora]|uniref:NACHT domain-containing protein n=1 Tax=Orbilia ellipsospora TaxID=2528407 RepID=A0AAV9XH16_9PEZI
MKSKSVNNVQKEMEDGYGRHSRRQASAKALTQDSYTIGWICALPLEMAASRAMLDGIHADLRNSADDHNGYIFGSIGDHNVVMACLPSGIYGTTPAALVASQMQSSFPSIRFYLMVGIGGGVPSLADIRLGDIVVSTPVGLFPGVVQHDRGKIGASGQFEQTGSLKGPPRGLLNIVSKLRAIHLNEGSQVSALLAEASTKLPAYFARPSHEDILFQAQYEHSYGNTCDYCDKFELVTRNSRDSCDPVIHYGIIASGNQVMKNGLQRDSTARQFGALCFEMEAAGLADVVECLVVRGICDYCDSHKNKEWQGYAAATAAAYTKELLLILPASKKSNRGFQDSNLEFESSNETGFDVDEISRFYKRDKLRNLRTLSFPQMDARIHNIALAHGNTCDWIFETEQFCRWISPATRSELERFNGVLWIKGKPGAGKSTLMKHIFNYFQKSSYGYTIAAYFFSARGAVLEKSRIGMLRSILYQLLDRFPEAYDLVFPLFQDKRRKHGENWTWLEGELETLLSELVPILKEPVLLLVDALDECDETDVRRVVSFLERLSLASMNSTGTSLRICLSSRHYPTISMRKNLDLILEQKQEHTRDIRVYVRDKLKLKDTRIRAGVLEKADGIFMWVVLVVEILNQAWENGDIEAVLEKLQEVPSDIDEVFRALLEKDNLHKPRTVFMFQLVLFAGRPLDPQELYSAVLFGARKEATLPNKKSLADDEIINRFIISNSMGLIEIIDAEPPSKTFKTVQFIHQTVIDFLLRNRRLQSLDSELTQDFEALSHSKIASCCLKYIQMSDLSTLAAQAPTVSLILHFDTDYPFLRYTVWYIFYHAEYAQRRGVGQKELIRCLQENIKVFRALKSVRNILVEEPRGYSSQYDWWKDLQVPESSLLYTLSFNHCQGLVAELLKYNPSIDINAPAGFYGTALHAAIAGYSQYYFRKRVEGTVKLLLRAGANVNTTGNDIFFNALHVAVIAGEHYQFERTATVISMLIKAGADVNMQGGKFGNVLQVAALLARSRNNGEIGPIIRILLDAGAWVNSQGGKYGNALQAAAASAAEVSGHLGHDIEMVAVVVRMLLKAGADVNAQGGHYGNALQAAVVSAMNSRPNSLYDPSFKIVDILLEAGANINAQGGKYGNALQAASICGLQRETTTSLLENLLRRGADANAQGGYYVSPVDAAFKSGCRRVRYLASKNNEGAFTTLNILFRAGAIGAAEANRNLWEYQAWVLEQATIFCRGPPVPRSHMAAYRGLRSYDIVPSYNTFRGFDSDSDSNSDSDSGSRSSWGLDSDSNGFRNISELDWEPGLHACSPPEPEVNQGQNFNPNDSEMPLFHSHENRTTSNSSYASPLSYHAIWFFGLIILLSAFFIREYF